MVSRNWWNLAASAAFAALVLSLPWEQIQGHPFVDYQQYVEHFLHEESIFEYTDFRGLVDYIINEALWEYLITALVHTVGIPIDSVFLGISALCVFTYSLFLARRHNVFAMLLLANPLLVTFAIEQLRLALAYSLLLIAYMIRRPLLGLTLAAVACFIHTSIVLIIAAYFVIHRLARAADRGDWDRLGLLMALCAIGVAVSAAIGPLRAVILGAVGDRRAVLGAANSSLVYSSFWMGLLALVPLQRKAFLRDEVNAYAVFVLAVATANVVTGGYTLRFLSIGLPMILSAMLGMTAWARVLAIFTYVIYMGFQWMYWAGVTL